MLFLGDLIFLPDLVETNFILSPTVIGVVLHRLGLKYNFGQFEVQRGEWMVMDQNVWQWIKMDETVFKWKWMVIYGDG